MASRPLDFAPGSDYAYSNFGYCLLGRIIERLTGVDYEKYMRDQFLGPMGIDRMRIGETQANDRLPDEVNYFDFPGAPWTRSIFPGSVDYLPVPYGGFHLRGMDAHGGWLASPIDLLRFVVAIDGSDGSAPYLETDTLRKMIERPNLPHWLDSPTYYGLGWSLRPAGNGADWWHSGSLPGTSAILVRSEARLAIAVLFNSLPRPIDRPRFDRDAETTLRQAADRVTRWPTHNLFLSRPPRPGATVP